MNEEAREEKEDKELISNLRLLRDLSNSDAFKTWRDVVVEPIIRQLEAELSSNEADNLPEPILRGKLKQLNSLKYIFKDVFEIAKSNLNISK